MPRDGSNIYSQPFPNVVEDTTIESTVYNGFTNDVAADLNAARPIVAGGTGATSADQALFNLGGEKAAQLVTNYDSHVWIPGSFRSAAAATAAPNGTAAFAGVVYINEALANPPTNSNVIVEARDLTSGTRYTRRKTAGTWDAWVTQAGSTVELDSAYVNVTGDTMTGPLEVNSTIKSNQTSTTGAYYFGTDSSRYLAHNGTTFDLAGGNLQVSLSIKTAGDLFTGYTGTSGVLRFGTDVNKYLYYNGTNFTLNGGPLVVNGGGTISVAATSGATDSSILLTDQAGVSKGQLLWYRADNSVQLSVYGVTPFKINVSGYTYLGTGFFGRAGVNGASGAYGVNIHNFDWSSPNLQAWVNTFNMGNITLTSDYRTKKDVTGLTSMWDTVKALRPVKYTQANFQPPSQAAHVAEQLAKAKMDKAAGTTPAEINTAPAFVADDIERWGFIAHELQETLVSSAATGVKDSPDHVQSPNPFTIIAALTRALQEAMARIEALEAR